MNLFEFVIIHLHENSVRWVFLSHRGQEKLRSFFEITQLLHNWARNFDQIARFQGLRLMLFTNLLIPVFCPKAREWTSGISQWARLCSLMWVHRNQPRNLNIVHMVLESWQMGDSTHALHFHPNPIHTIQEKTVWCSHPLILIPQNERIKRVKVLILHKVSDSTMQSDQFPT